MKRQYRLRRNEDFQRVRRLGKFYASPFVVLAFLRNELDHSRFGFVVGKRLGKAVRRNKIKRQMRELIRLSIPRIKAGFDIVFVARQPMKEADYRKIQQTLEYLLRKANLLRN